MRGGTGQDDEARHRSACGGSGNGLRCEDSVNLMAHNTHLRGGRGGGCIERVLCGGTLALHSVQVKSTLQQEETKVESQ